MRVLLLFRGAPGVGKTTYIRENGLSNYCLSSDDIRMMYQSPMLQVDGTEQIAMQNEKAVWNTLFELLEARMERGEFVVIDATNSKTQEMNRYKDLANTYRYRIYCIDMTDVPIEECKRRNLLRPEYKRVPEASIDKMYARFKVQKIPAGIKTIKPNELDTIWFKQIDLSQYKKIHHIGDIHGCYTVLKEYLKDGFKDDEFYIFCGDYIDRGLENVEVVKFLSEIIDKKNVFLLEGNHERWLWYWSHGGTGKSKEFETKTRKQLEAANVDPKIARMIYRKLGQCAYYKYGDKTVFVSHAGISCIPENLTKVATDQMIHGVGHYGDYIEVAKSFERLIPENVYQIFGHRNTEGLPVKMFDRTFNLEGRVEFGGQLRIVTLDEDGFEAFEIQNTVFKEEEKRVPIEYTAEEKSVMEIVDEMRKNKFINEKKYGNISSFNFTRDAFYKKEWNKMTTKARGLFIDTTNGKVVARSYQKFFAIGERPETEFDFLKYKLAFPVTAYVKENGFLGMVSWDHEKDDWLICSKSTPEGPFAELMRKSFIERLTDPESLKKYLKSEDVTLVFECVDMENDPHIIKYDHSELFLLDIIKNDLNYKKKQYSEVVEIANKHGFVPKTKAFEFNDWDGFRNWYNEIQAEDYLYNGKEIEGFVIEDNNGWMMKIKLYYYSFWKHMRSVADEVFRSGNFRRTGSLTTPEANYFFGFCKKLYEQEEHPTRIIELREMFLKEQNDGR